MNVFREAIYGVRFYDKSKEGAIERREEIVRCRDCMNVDVEDYGAWGHVWHCERIGEVEPDGFCAWGERREQ